MEDFFTLLAELEALEKSPDLMTSDRAWARYQQIKDKLAGYQNYVPKEKKR